MKDTIEAMAVVESGARLSFGPADIDAPGWRLRSFRGTMWSDEKLAGTPGPMITLFVGLACVVLGLSVIWRGDASETAAGFWPPAGAALVAMLVLPRRRWGWVAAGIALPTIIGLLFGVVPLAPALWWALANCVEPAVAASVLHRCRTAPWLTRGRLMLVFLISAVVVAPMIGAILGTIGTARGYDKPVIGAWLEWALGDGLGVLVVVPLVMTYTTRGLVRRTPGEKAALATLIITATALTFADLGGNGAALVPYVILVGLIWAGMRFGTSAAATAGFVIGLGANFATAKGYGPFAGGSGSADVVTLQIFLAIALVASFIVAAMASDLADRDQVHRLLTQQATHDALTGLPNRVLFAEQLHHALQAKAQTGRAVGLMLIDLDDFKKVNDRHGHPIGDMALGIVARHLRCRTRPNDLLARLGGDEFVVISTEIDGSEHLRAIAIDVLRGLDQPIDIGGSPSQLTACIGMVLADADDPVTPTELLRRADLALYHAKRTTDVNIALFDEALEEHTRRRADLDEELNGAIARGELSVVYQPIVSLATGKVSELEALARWTNRRFGVVAPDEFIPIAEASGLINVLGDWVLEVACRQMATWRAEDLSSGLVRARMAVNVSARQLCDLAFPDRVARILAATALPADSLSIEITETAVLDDLDASARVLGELRALGVRLSMDDFGTGYSSLTYLRRIPVHTLKIDRSFVDGLGDLAEDTAIVESIINLGHSLGVEVVAEGVETMWQLQHLVQLGCDHGQGYLWSRPVDALTAGALLHDTFYVAVSSHA